MKFKFKTDENTTLDFVRKELDAVKSANVNEIPLNYLLRITEYLGVKNIQGTGSSIRFQHDLLKGIPPYYGGMFQIHKEHKGGNEDCVKRFDFNKFLYPALIQIIEIKLKK